MMDSAQASGPNRVRPPAVAGAFYPAAPAALRAAVEGLLENAGNDAAPNKAIGGMVPHAGYPYSGACAATVYARMRGARPGRVVLLGRSHHHAFTGLSIPPADHLRSPLGDLPHDTAFAEAFGKVFGLACPEAHAAEHTLEVQFPFLQILFESVPIVPVLFGQDPQEAHAEAGRWLAAHLDPADIVLASTDLSHFLSDDEAKRIDRRSLDAVMSGDYQNVIQGTRDASIALCGATAVVAAMACAQARGATGWTLQDYRSSAAVSGDTARVVGYGAISMDRPR